MALALCDCCRASAWPECSLTGLDFSPKTCIVNWYFYGLLARRSASWDSMEKKKGCWIDNLARLRHLARLAPAFPLRYLSSPPCTQTRNTRSFSIEKYGFRRIFNKNINIQILYDKKLLIFNDIFSFLPVPLLHQLILPPLLVDLFRVSSFLSW